ncbi:MAG: peptidoglycan-binding protein [Clostridia bacterium]|nr:peptidoglycan-binding protein [Clostridia bacterium]
MKRAHNKSGLRLPLGIIILIVGIAGMVAVILVFSVTLRFGKLSFLKDANRESEYLTIPQFEIEAPVLTTPEPSPTAEATALATEVPVDSGTIVVSQYATLQIGAESDSVAALHNRLMELGYMDYDEVSSLYSVSTENAVKLFQRANNLDQTGIASAQLQEMLFASDAQSYRAKMNDDGIDVKDAQERLWELGYYADKISGYYGPKTETAVRLFQTKNAMDVDGEINRDVYTILYSDQAVSLATPTPTPSPTPGPKQASSGGKTTSSTPKPGTTATPRVTAVPGKEKSSYGSGISGMIACAEAQIGDPYLWGAHGPDAFDCSGLAYYCMTKAGLSVSRSSSSSYAANDRWKKIDKISDLKKGDLIFWCSPSSDKVSHVGICTGGSGFIHASSSKGQVVRSSIVSGKYWDQYFVCGRRVFG